VVVGRASESFLYRRGATDRWNSARPSRFQEIVVGYLEAPRLAASLLGAGRMFSAVCGAKQALHDRYRARVPMTEKSRSELILECYRRAAEARRIADSATDPLTEAEFREIERRWLSLARGYGAEEQC
jgi:hypothetical protein